MSTLLQWNVLDVRNERKHFYTYPEKRAITISTSTSHLFNRAQLQQTQPPLAYLTECSYTNHSTSHLFSGMQLHKSQSILAYSFKCNYNRNSYSTYSMECTITLKCKMKPLAVLLSKVHYAMLVTLGLYC